MANSKEEADDLERRINNIITWQNKQQAEDIEKIRKAVGQLTNGGDE